jgi:multidrug efflux pump subunit AcrA (membrane-fusion protein)
MKILFLLMLASSMTSFSKEEDKSKVVLKPWSAVSQFNELDGFKLTNKAEKNLGVSFFRLRKGSSWEVPKSALLSIKHSRAVYRKWNDWITMVLVKVQEVKGQSVVIKSVDLQAGDKIAVTGITFLRMTEADLNSDTVDACSH